MRSAERIMAHLFALDMLSGGVPEAVVLREIRAIQADALEAAKANVIAALQGDYYLEAAESIVEAKINALIP